MTGINDVICGAGVFVIGIAVLVDNPGVDSVGVIGGIGDMSGDMSGEANGDPNGATGGT